MKSFQGKVALISGGTSGIGRATSVAFAREGERVEVASRRVKENEETLKLVKEGWSDGISVKTDVSKEAEVKAKEGKHNRSLFVVMILVLITFIGTLIPFAQRESLGEKSIIPKESRLSELSPAIITEFEGELNKRLLDSRVKPFFYKASTQRDEINIFLDRHGWMDLSLIEKGDVIEQVAKICRVVETSVGIKAEPPIHFYDRDSKFLWGDYNKELASWSRQGGGIIE
jgi:hypothetical protein